MRNELKEHLIRFNQSHLISEIDEWSDPLVADCLHQILSWKEEDLFEQQSSWQKKDAPEPFESLPSCAVADDQPVMDVSKPAVIILAGGQGSRLGIDQPKGCFSILGKSLFERHAEKIRSNHQTVAVMTSGVNHQATVDFFHQNQNFGLPDVHFFSQGTLPLFDESGQWFWEKPGRLAEGADGNGSVFSALKKAGLMAFFEKQLIQIIPVDNPLAESYDPIHTSFHMQTGADLSIKCIRLADPMEPTGRLVNKHQKLSIVEFAELSNEQKQKNILANTGLLLLNGGFFHSLSLKNFPFHWAYRSATAYENGRMVRKMSYKAERFIVDALLFADRAQSIVFSRSQCFAPLKDKNSILEIERLINRSR
jgi:UDP-N-acetylglucosamine/UDP-N-acetylgalactosamine diphosphorylase